MYEIIFQNDMPHACMSKILIRLVQDFNVYYYDTNILTGAVPCYSTVLIGTLQYDVTT